MTDSLEQVSTPGSHPLPLPETADAGCVVADRYRLERVVGEGGAGVVYAARDLRNDTVVAVKLLRPLTEASDTTVSRFMHEAQTLASLSHPNIVRGLDAGRADDGTVYQAMEFLRGQTLYQRRGGTAAMPLNEVLEIALPVLRALQGCHDAGIVHRDVKPSNIMLVEGAVAPRPVLLDFGVAKWTARPRAVSTSSGRWVGTLDYMAPEQVQGGRHADPRLDQWSTAAVIFDCLTGRLPLTRVQRAAGALSPSDARELAPDVPAHVARALFRALQPLPGRRFDSVRQFGAALCGEC